VDGEKEHHAYRDVCGDRVPAVYTCKQHGAAMREAPQMTFVMKKGTGGWLIAGWTWTGPKAKAAASASAKK
jgi:hypothetical protein